MTTIAGVKLADMKRSKESLSPKNVGKISPDPYSYEHRISLDEDAMDKLGMNELPKVGDKYHVHGIAHVASVNMNQDTGGKKRKRVELQFHQMGVAPAPKSSTGGAKGAVESGIKDANESSFG
jgi:hypothetical protein